jgi:hypothetical protein
MGRECPTEQAAFELFHPCAHIVGLVAKSDDSIHIGFKSQFVACCSDNHERTAAALFRNLEEFARYLALDIVAFPVMPERSQQEMPGFHGADEKPKASSDFDRSSFTADTLVLESTQSRGTAALDSPKCLEELIAEAGLVAFKKLSASGTNDVGHFEGRPAHGRGCLPVTNTLHRLKT